jgi:hypothetical protein
MMSICSQIADAVQLAKPCLRYSFSFHSPIFHHSISTKVKQLTEALQAHEGPALHAETMLWGTK